jgi:hypothetical protein
MKWDSIFERALNVGPFRFNSKSGVGASIGVKGARITMTPRGTEFSRLRSHAPDREFLAGNIALGAYVRVLSEPGKQCAVYTHHRGDRSRGSYEVKPGNYQERLAVNLPEGSYRGDGSTRHSGRL